MIVDNVYLLCYNLLKRNRRQGKESYEGIKADIELEGKADMLCLSCDRSRGGVSATASVLILLAVRPAVSYLRNDAGVSCIASL